MLHSDIYSPHFSFLGIANLIITEDSDLVVFGCPRVLFKMDLNGNGILIDKDKLFLSLGGQAGFFTDEKYCIYLFNIYIHLIIHKIINLLDLGECAYSLDVTISNL